MDVDGTLTLIGDRSPDDTRNVAIDPEPTFVMVTQALVTHPDAEALIVVAGSDEIARRVTEARPAFNEIPLDRRLLRRTRGQRADNIVKAEVYDSLHRAVLQGHRRGR